MAIRRFRCLSLAAACAAIGAGGLALPARAAATFPGSNGNLVLAAFSPASGTVTQLFTVDAAGQNAVQIASNPEGDFDPAYSPDGETIAFLRQAPGGFQHIWAMGQDGSGQTQLTFHDLDRSPSFFPDGRIAFAGIPVTPGFFEVWVMNPNGSGQTQITNQPFSTEDPAVSPDGQKIAFSEYDGSDSEIYVINADGSGQTPVTTNPGSDTQPSWSPDSRRIVFQSQIGSDDEIVATDPNGQNPVQLTDNSSSIDDLSPVFSPDGHKIAFVRSNGSSEVFTMNADGSNQSPLYSALPVGALDWQALNSPAIDVTAGPQRSPKKVTVTVVSQNENATATLGGTLRAPKPKVGASRKKTVTLEPLTIKLQPAVPVTVDISVAGKGRKVLKKALKAGKKPKGTVTASVTDDLGAATTDSVDIKYKRRKKK